jgi:hypothetical protein
VFRKRGSTKTSRCLPISQSDSKDATVVHQRSLSLDTNLRHRPLPVRHQILITNYSNIAGAAGIHQRAGAAGSMLSFIESAFDSTVTRSHNLFLSLYYAPQGSTHSTKQSPKTSQPSTSAKTFPSSTKASPAPVFPRLSKLML